MEKLIKLWICSHKGVETLASGCGKGGIDVKTSAQLWKSLHLERKGLQKMWKGLHKMWKGYHFVVEKLIFYCGNACENVDI